MNIAFLGGLVAAAGTHETADESKWHTKNHESFPEACRLLGSQIFTLGHTLVVASDKTDTADYYAVEGAVQAVKRDPANNRGKILLVRPKLHEEDLFTNCRSTLTFLTERWGPDEAALLKLSIVRHSDAAVILGGAEKAYYAGIAGAVSRRRVVPVGAFGGAGAELIYEFRNTFNRASDDWRDHMLEPDLLSQLENPWNDNVRSLVLKALGAEGRRRLKIFIVHGHGLDHELLENFLNRNQDELNVQLTVMKEEFASGATIPAKLERLAGEGQGAIVVATPDDIGGIANGANLRKRHVRTFGSSWDGSGVAWDLTAYSCWSEKTISSCPATSVGWKSIGTWNDRTNKARSSAASSAPFGRSIGFGFRPAPSSAEVLATVSSQEHPIPRLPDTASGHRPNTCT